MSTTTAQGPLPHHCSELSNRCTWWGVMREGLEGTGPEEEDNVGKCRWGEKVWPIPEAWQRQVTDLDVTWRLQIGPTQTNSFT